MNTTPIEQCSLSADAEYTVREATERGWSRFAIFPSGALLGTSPDGVEDEPVPNYAQTVKDAAPELLAVVEAYLQWHDGDESDETMKRWLDVEGIPAMRAAIAKAKGEPA